MTEQHIKQVEEWSTTKFKEVIFDTNSSGWDESHEKFFEAVYEKENLAFVVEDDQKNIFGGFVYSKIEKCVEGCYSFDSEEEDDSDIKDPNSFIFSLYSNGRSEKPLKFEIKPSSSDNAFLVIKDDDDLLLFFGSDLVIRVGESRDKCFLSGEAYSFNGQEKIMLGKVGCEEKFTMERIQVWQMEETAETKGKLEERQKVKEKEIIESRAKYQEGFDSLKELTGMNITDLLFDSDYHNWNTGSSEFDEKLLGKSQVAIMIYDNNNNVFGGYFHCTIDKLEECMADANSFMFSLKSNGRLDKPMKFPIKDENKAFYLNSKNSAYLFTFGKGGLYDNDMVVHKKNFQYDGGNKCTQSVYDYKGYKDALCGDEYFEIERFFALQMA